MKKLIFLFAILCLLELYGCSHAHQWTAADCVNPATCSECRQTKGAALGHNWIDATCTSARKCTVCSQLQGEPLGHQESEWQCNEYDAVNAVGSFTQFCVKCGVVLEEQDHVLSQLHDGEHFLFTPAEFVERLELMIDKVSGYNTLSVQYFPYDEDITLFVAEKDEDIDAVLAGEEYVNLILLLDGSSILTWSQMEDPNIDYIVLQMSLEDIAVEIMIAMIMVCEPSFENFTTNENVLTDLYAFMEQLIRQPVVRNGIRYELDNADEVLRISIE